MDVIKRALKVYSGEGPQIVFFTILAVLMQAGVSIGLSVADSLFLTRVGPDQLPVVYVLTPAAMFVLVPLLSFLTSRIGMNRVFDLVQVLIAAFGFLFFLLLSVGPDSLNIYYLIRLYSYIWLVSLYTVYWNYLDSYFQILDAKRLFPIFGGGLAIGSGLGGAVVSLLSSYIPLSVFFLIWSGIAGASLFAGIVIRKKFRVIESEETSEESFIQLTSQVIGHARKSSYVILINILLLLTLVLATFAEFQYLGVFTAGRSEQEIASLYGELFVYVNIFNLFVAFFLFNKLVVRLGVKNTLLIQPFIFLFAFSFFYFFGGFTAAVFAFVAYHGFMQSFDNNNWNFLFNAVSSEARKQVRTFTEGLMDPVATAFAGSMLILFSVSTDTEWLKIASIAVSVVHIGIALSVRLKYPQAMQKNLQKQWLDFSLSQDEIQNRFTETDLDFFQMSAVNKNEKQAVTSLYFLSASRKPAALEGLITLYERGLNEQELQKVLVRILDGDDSFVVQRAVMWSQEAELPLSVLRELGSHALLPSRRVLPFLTQENPQARQTAVVTLWNSREILDNFLGLDELRSLLEADRSDRLAAIQALGYTRNETYAHYLATVIRDGDPELRLTAVESMVRLAGPSSSRLIPVLLELLKSGSETEAGLALEGLGKIADAESVAPMLSLASSMRPADKRKIELIAQSIGLKSVPALVAVLGDRNQSHQARSLAARTLARLSFAQLELMVADIAKHEIQKAYDNLHRSEILSSSGSGNTDSGKLLIGYYHSNYKEVCNFILEILALAGRVPNYEQIASALQSGNARLIGDSVEMLEQNVSYRVFRNLLPLVDSRTTRERLDFYKKHFAVADLTEPVILEDAIRNGTDAEQAVAAYHIYNTADDSSRDMVIRRIHRLGTNPGHIFRTVFRELIEHHNTGKAIKFSLVQKMSVLQSDPVLSGLSPDYLAGLAEHLENRESGKSGPHPFDRSYKVNGKDIILEGRHIESMVVRDPKAGVVILSNLAGRKS